VGHGELTLDPGRDDREWLGALRDLLEKANYELASVDPSGPDAREPFEGCAAVVIAGPRTPFGPEESNRLRAWMLQGGSLLAALGPMEAGGESGMAGPGLDDVLAPFGIGLDEDLVHDVGAAASIPDTHGEGFFVSAKPHPVTAGLAGEAGAHPPRVAVFFARSLRHVSSAGAPWAAELLATDADAYAKTSLVGASGWTGAPDRQPADPRGPFVVAMAAERAKIGTAAHGPRAMVVGSRFALAEDNWKQPHALHGMAFLIDSALSWLTARPSIVDVPDKPELAAGMRVSDEGRDEVRRYVLVLMPLAALLMGAAVWAWRKSTEGKPYERVRGAGEPS
ncbi:MAG TPA: Gldg family protein, partial [Polyangiaceae bacterium]|nr:Gldg family protein [Polyangiaceae bacterium]